MAQPLLEPHGLNYPLTADGVIRACISAGAYLALIAILGLGIGALLRNSAGGIVATLGILAVLPILVAILSGLNDSFRDLGGLSRPPPPAWTWSRYACPVEHLTQSRAASSSSPGQP